MPDQKPFNTMPMSPDQLVSPIDTTSQSVYLQQWQFPKGIIKQQMLASTTSVGNGDLYYGDGNNNFKRLPIGTVSQFLIVSGGIPAWSILIAPSYTTTQRNALTNVTLGTIIYNTTTNKLNVYTGSWEQITSA